jgi:hypothetical protein
MRYRKFFRVIAVAATFIATTSTLSAQNNSDCSEGNKEGMCVRTALVTFDRGTESWQADVLPQFGGFTAQKSGGFPGAQGHFIANGVFGAVLYNKVDPRFIGDLSHLKIVTLSIDLKSNKMVTEGTTTPTPRHLVLSLRSYALGRALNLYDLYASVEYDLGNIQPTQEWKTYVVSFTPGSIELPNGWAGYGFDDPVTGAPGLPAGITFTDVLAQVDEVAFTTFQTGFFYDLGDFDLNFDNIRLTRECNQLLDTHCR